MARLNTLNLNFAPRTHEGALARHVSPELQLRRSVLACLLWESQFYEDGVEIAGRIAELVPKVAAEKVAALAVEAREHFASTDDSVRDADRCKGFRDAGRYRREQVRVAWCLFHHDPPLTARSS